VFQAHFASALTEPFSPTRFFPYEFSGGQCQRLAIAQALSTHTRLVVLDEPVIEVRPGFTCTADVTTATRKSVVSVPIPAVAVRELVYDANGQVVKEPKTDNKRRRSASVEPVASAAELPPGHTRKETEGVFLVRDGKAEFLPIKMGIAGDKYFEVLSGLKPGDQVITGPYNSVRGMNDGSLVKVDNSIKAK